MHRDGGDAKNCAAHTHGGAQKYSNLIHFTELHYMHQRWKSKKLTIFGFNNFEGGHILQFLEQSNLDVTAQGSWLSESRKVFGEIWYQIDIIS